MLSFCVKACLITLRRFSKQGKAEVVPSSSLVEVEVEVWVKVEVGFEVEVGVDVEFGVEVEVGVEVKVR